MEKTQPRIPFLDNAKLVLMFLVIFGHTIEPLVRENRSRSASTIYVLLYLFHMPAWTFLAGITSKTKNTARDVMRLAMIYVPFQLLATARPHNLTLNYWREFLTPWWILWFLVSLVIWKLLLPLAAKSLWSLPVSILVALGIGECVDCGRFLSISRALVFLPFFIGGYFFGRKVLEIARDASAILKVSACGLFCLAAIVVSKLPINPGFLYESESYQTAGLNSFPFGAALRLSHLAAACVLGFALLCLVAKKENRLTTYGRRTLTMMVVHAFLLRYLWRFYPEHGMWISISVLLAVAVVVCWVSGAPFVHVWITALSRFPEKRFQALAAADSNSFPGD